MQYFTPELHLAANSLDDDVADAAELAWEKARAGYREHLAKLKPDLPARVFQLAFESDYHDYEVIGYKSHILSDPLTAMQPRYNREWFAYPGTVFVLTLRMGEATEAVFFFLWGEVRVSPPPHNWPQTEEKFFLYDELSSVIDRDLIPREYRLNILLSDGSELVIPFMDTFRVPIPTGGVLRRTQWQG